jgi:leucyl aminopeptidase
MPLMKHQFCVQAFAKSDCIKVRVVNDTAVFAKEYPCFAAVNRAASTIERHRGQLIYLEYNADSKDVTETVMLIGKVCLV